MKEIRAASDHIAGWGGAIRLRTGEGSILYWSVSTHLQSVATGRRFEVRLTWVSAMMRAWPHRALLVVEGDANTWIGRRVDGAEALEEVVGSLHRSNHSAAGDVLLDSMESMGFMAPASFVKQGGRTNCGLQGSSRSIDITS